MLLLYLVAIPYLEIVVFHLFSTDEDMNSEREAGCDEDSEGDKANVTVLQDRREGRPSDSYFSPREKKKKRRRAHKCGDLSFYKTTFNSKVLFK